MIRAGAIDIGTNTTLALLADGDSDTLRTVKDSMTPNRLGELIKEDGSLPADVIALNVDLLHELAQEFRRLGARDIAVCATAVLRAARNREEFQRAVREVVGLDLQILSGTQEAAMTFAGAVSAMELLPHEKINVMDLGGGSTEIIFGQGNRPGQSISLDAGAVYLTKRYFSLEETAEPEQIAKLRREIRETLTHLLVSLENSDAPWVLVGGTVVTLAMLKTNQARYQPERVSGTELSPQDIDILIGRFAGRHPDELQSLPAMPQGRGRYILAGTLLLRELYDVLGISNATVSERGLRHGLWLHHFGRQEV